jgi:hypothetical protein
MRKEISLLIILGFGLAFAASCISYKVSQKRMDPAVNWSNSNAQILAIQKKSGERIDFPLKNPAAIRNEAVVGNALQTEEIDRSKIANLVETNDGKITEITSLDGIRHPILSAKIEGGKIRYVAKDALYLVAVLLNEIELIWTKEMDVAGSIVTTTIAFMPFLAVLIGIGSSLSSNFWR